MIARPAVVAVTAGTAQPDHEDTEDPFDGRYDTDGPYCVNRIRGAAGAPPTESAKNILTRDDVEQAVYFARCVTCTVWSCRVASVACLVVLLVIYYHTLNAITVSILQIESKFAQTIVSMSFVLLDTLCNWLCHVLTSIECHTFWSTYRKSDCFKSLFFRIAAFSIFAYVQRDVFTVSATAAAYAGSTWFPDMFSASSSSRLGTCTAVFAVGAATVLTRQGVRCIDCLFLLRAEQHLNFLMVTTLMSAPMQFLMAFGYSRFARLRRACCKKECTVVPMFVCCCSSSITQSPRPSIPTPCVSPRSAPIVAPTALFPVPTTLFPAFQFDPNLTITVDDPSAAATRPPALPTSTPSVLRRPHRDFKRIQFNLPEEYTALIFRQFVIVQAMLLVPLAPVFGILGSAIQYWMVKYKLVRMSQRPERTASHYTRLIGIFFAVNMLAMVFAYPNGWYWLRQEVSASNICT